MRRRNFLKSAAAIAARPAALLSSAFAPINLAALAAEGGSILFPAGTYLLRAGWITRYEG